MKHVVIGFSSVAFPLTLLLASVVAAQSAQPQKDIPAIAKTANGVVVSIITSDKDGKPVSQGTGFLVSKDGRIVTNYHVIKGASSAIVKLPDGAFYDVDGVVALDKARDLAVIKAHGQNFRVAALGNSDRVQVGEEIVAIGSPLSLESTVSSGIVSGIRSIKEEGGKFLQITAPISPGSSGGPLFNMAGEVVGITTLYLKGGENLNFAIPVNDAKLLLSAGSKVQDFPVETEAAKSETHAEAAPSTSMSASTARAYYKQLYDAGGFIDAHGFVNNLVDFICFDDDTSSQTFFAFGAIATSIQSSAPYVKVFRWNQYLQAAFPDGRMLEVLFYEKGVMTGSATYNGVKGWENKWVVEESLKSGKIKSSISIEPTTMRYNETFSSFEQPNVAPISHSGVCEKIPAKQAASNTKDQDQLVDIPKGARTVPVPASAPAADQLVDIPAGAKDRSPTEVFNLRSQCAQLGKAIDEWSTHDKTELQSVVSNYSVKDNRCYVDLRFLVLSGEMAGSDDNTLYDGQTREVLAYTSKDGRTGKSGVSDKIDKTGGIFVNGHLDLPDECFTPFSTDEAIKRAGDCSFDKANAYIDERMKRDDQ